MQCKVYDDSVSVHIVRNGIERDVMFSCLKEGDIVRDPGNDIGTIEFIVGEDAHFCGDSTYPGYLVRDTDGNDYYPEDFGAELLEEYDSEEE